MYLPVITGIFHKVKAVGWSQDMELGNFTPSGHKPCIPGRLECSHHSFAHCALDTVSSWNLLLALPAFGPSRSQGLRTLRQARQGLKLHLPAGP